MFAFQAISEFLDGDLQTVYAGNWQPGWPTIDLWAEDVAGDNEVPPEDLMLLLERRYGERLNEYRGHAKGD